MHNDNLIKSIGECISAGWRAANALKERKKEKKCIANVIEHIKRYIWNPFFARTLFCFSCFYLHVRAQRTKTAKSVAV